MSDIQVPADIVKAITEYGDARADSYSSDYDPSIRDVIVKLRVWGASLQKSSGETAAEPKQDGESIWLLAFADQEAQPPLAFSGAGADAAARRKFERASDMWTCRLFRCVAQSGYGPPVTTDTRCPTCGESRPSHWAWCTDPLNKPAATTGEEHGS
jgi:hypothetical protein